MADARSYRVAKRLPVLAVAQFHAGTLISLKRRDRHWKRA